MNYKFFIIGIAFLFVGYIIYRMVRGRRDEEDMSMRTYLGLWGCVIIGFISGIVYLLKSLPSHI